MRFLFFTEKEAYAAAPSAGAAAGASGAAGAVAPSVGIAGVAGAAWSLFWSIIAYASDISPQRAKARKEKIT